MLHLDLLPQHAKDIPRESVNESDVDLELSSDVLFGQIGVKSSLEVVKEELLDITVINDCLENVTT